MKKILSLLLVLIMAMAIMPMSAFASESTPDRVDLNGGYILVEDGRITFASDTITGDVVIPKTANGKKITSLTGNRDFPVGFEDNRNITSVTIEGNTGDYEDEFSLDLQVFAGCDNLRKITLGGGIKNLSGSHNNDIGLTLSKLTITDGIRNLDPDTFNFRRTSDFELVLTKSATPRYYVDSNGMVILTDPDLKEIVPFVLACTLDPKTTKSVTLPTSKDIDMVHSWVFKGFSALESVTVPSNIKSIGDSAFENCTSLKEIKFLGDSIGLWRESLKGCSSLEKIDLPKQVGLGVNVFSETSIKELALNTNTVGAENITDMPKLEKLVINNGARQLGDEREHLDFKGFVMNCPELKEIHIPPTVDFISKSILYRDTASNVKYGSELEIHGKTGSKAEAWAKEMGFTFVSTGQMAPFTDIIGHWAYDAISWGFESKIISGMSNTQFAPNALISRADFVTLLWRLDGGIVPEKESTDEDFTDIKESDYFYDAVRWASKNEIVFGKGNGLFKPNDRITREEMAAVLERFIKYNEIELDPINSYSYKINDSDVSDWAKAPIIYCLERGVLSGDNVTISSNVASSDFYPQRSASRAEAAQVIFNLVSISDI